jgi:L-lactate dehydrogenase complex protein LldF
MGVQRDPWLPFASSLCGACAEVCPVKIDIPRLLLELRSDVTQAQKKAGQNGLERLAFHLFAWTMRHPILYEIGGKMAAALAPKGQVDGAAGEPRGWIRKLPALMNVAPLKRWLSQRDLPPPAPRSFRELWRERLGTRRQ